MNIIFLLLIVKKSKKKVLNYFFSFLEYCKVEDLDGGGVNFIRGGFEKRVSSIPLYDAWNLDVFLKSGVKGTLQEIHLFDCWKTAAIRLEI